LNLPLLIRAKRLTGSLATEIDKLCRSTLVILKLEKPMSQIEQDRH
jgi:hypothetical protein